jgi:RNA-directed DNA polymerase
VRSSPSSSPRKKNRLSDLPTRQSVAEVLGITDKELCYVLYALLPEKKYLSFQIPKKSGGHRQIFAPIPQLKYLQRKLKTLIEIEYKPRYTVHGFIKQKSIKTNAVPHLRKRYVLNIDLENFFPTITFPRIRGMFMSKPYNCDKKTATVLAQMCCNDGKLPQGAPTSPLISNMICSKLDGQLSKLAKEHGWTFTRYVDDMTFATNKKSIASDIAVFEDGRWKAGAKLTQIIIDNGFKINNNKVRMQHFYDRQEVTGIVINKKLNIRRSYIRNLRAILHNWRKNGLLQTVESYFSDYSFKEKPDTAKAIKHFIEAVKGKIEHLGHIRGEKDPIYFSFLKQINDLVPDLLSEDKRRILGEHFDLVNSVLEKLLVIEAENDETANQGTGFYLENYGLVTCAHVINLPNAKITVSNRRMKKIAEAKIKTISAELDLAILETTTSSQNQFQICTDETELSANTEIILAGFPDHSLTKTGDYYPARIRSFETFLGNPFYKIDNAIYEGQSGGPVFNQRLEVVGIASRGKKDESDKSNKDFLGFYGFIPVNQLKKLRKV